MALPLSDLNLKMLEFNDISFSFTFLSATLSRGYKRIRKNSGGMSGTQLLAIINGGSRLPSIYSLFLTVFIVRVKERVVVQREA